MRGRDRQVVLACVALRWLWLMLPPILLTIVAVTVVSCALRGGSDAPFAATVFGVGLPALLGVQWFVAVTKWGFANPGAWLTPGHYLLVVVAEDNVKRVRLTAQNDNGLPAGTAGPGVPRCGVEEATATVCSDRFDGQLVSEVRDTRGVDVTIHGLNQEEIFVEMHHVGA